MKRNGLTLLFVAALSSCVLFSSCIGSFNLSNKVLSWNKGVGSKFVNELVFAAFWIIPVYEITTLADVLVINSIEFWSGNNPVADAGKVRTVKTENGTYAIETRKDGYHIQKEGNGNELDLVFDEKEQVWSVDVNGQGGKLLKFNGDDEVVMFLPNGKEMNIELSKAGVLAFRQAVEGYSYYAAN